MSGFLTAEKCPVTCPKHHQIKVNNSQCCHFKKSSSDFSIELYVVKCCGVKGSSVFVCDAVERRELDRK